MSGSLANITIVIRIYFAICFLFPKPEAIVSLLRPPWMQTGPEFLGGEAAGGFGLELLCVLPVAGTHAGPGRILGFQQCRPNVPAGLCWPPPSCSDPPPQGLRLTARAPELSPAPFQARTADSTRPGLVGTGVLLSGPHR